MQKLQEMKKAFEKSEKNKVYQKEYYQKNKTKLLSNLCEKMECELCGRQVCKYYISSHWKSKICKKVIERNKFIKDIKNDANKDNEP